MISFGVSPEKQKALEDRMNRLNVKEQDIHEKFILSAGKGGQNVNKVSTAVYLKHIPTGTEVKCQQERSQALNRYIARKILLDKIEAQILGRKSVQQMEIEKIRRQKRKRSRRAKDKMLRDKKIHGEKKKSRSRPDISEYLR